MGNGRILAFIVSLSVAAAVGAPPAAAELTKAQKKEKRDKLLADLDAEVAKLVPIVTNVQKRAACPASKPGRRRLAVLGKYGPPFCRNKLDPHKKQIMQWVSDIDGVIDDDNRAGWVRSYWAQHVQSLETQLVHLDLMKRKHIERTGAGKQCKTTSDAMLQRMRDADTARTLEQVEAARTQAGKDGLILKEVIAAQERILSDMVQWDKNVHLFKPDNQYDKAWQPVFEALHESSKAMLAEWQSAWDEAKKTCEPAAKGERWEKHWELENQAFLNLKQKVADDLQAWRDKAREAYRFDCKSMKDLLDKFPDGEGDDDGDLDTEAFDTEAQTMKEQLGPLVEGRRDELAVFDQRCDRLVAARNGYMGSADKYQAWKAEMEAVKKDAIKKERDKLDKVLKDGIHKFAKGTRNPKIQLWVEVGKKAHKAMEKQDKYECRLADPAFCAKRKVVDGVETDCEKYRRPDCISVKQCKIWEFKPDNTRAINKGNGQLADYKTMVEKHYNFALKLWRDKKLGSFKVVGTESILKELDDQCAKGGDLDLVPGEVATYKPKEFEYTCAEGSE